MMKTSYQLSGGIRTVWVLLGGYTTTCDCRDLYLIISILVHQPVITKDHGMLQVVFAPLER